MGAAIGLVYSDAPVRTSLTALRTYGSGAIDDAHRAMGNYMVGETVLNFENERAPNGSPWVPSKRVKKHGGKTLQLHSYLKNTQTYNLLGDHEGFEWGSPMKYARAHQLGATITMYARSQSVWRGKRSKRFVKAGRKGSVQSHVTIKGKGADGSWTITLPARAFLGMNQQAEQGLVEIGANHLARRIGGVVR